MTTLSPENSLSARLSASFILEKRKPSIDKTEWDGFFDENGQLAKSRDFICVNILERGLHPSVKTEAWKFLTGYYSWQSSQDERLTMDSARRKNYESLCQMYEKIQPLLENLHRNFLETRNNITCDIQKLYDKDPLGNVLIDKKKLEKILLLSYVCNSQAEYQRGFHHMVMLFQLMVEHDHETFWFFHFFLQKTEHSCVINIGVSKNLNMLNDLINFMDPVFAEHLRGKGAGTVQSLFPWFCFCFQRAFKSFEDVWRLWEVLLTGKPCRNFQVLVAYSLLQMVREQVLKESMVGNDILLLPRPAMETQDSADLSMKPTFAISPECEIPGACNNLIDLDADEVISAACLVYAELIQKDVPQPLKDFFL
uniref:TBC1 domain family member 21 n=1 Tax=Rousettus aegyptiacus TaxID=9407 RepID=A0A7J8IUD8_ROUAE|nr:TBC1 domain family member 21 [Rousettus aegyptiacus]